MTWGPIVDPPVTPWCKASVTPFGHKTEEKSGRRRKRLQFRGPLLLSAMLPARFLAQSSESMQ